MDDLIEEMLAEYEPRFILDNPIPEDEERRLPRLLRPQWPITDPTRGEPLEIWLLGGQDRRLSNDQFVLQNGRTYRTQGSHERLKETCANLGNPELTERAENQAASIMTKEKNSWKPTPASLLPDIQKACVEHGHGGLGNTMGYDTREIVSIDMKASYPASFQGLGKANPYFRFCGAWSGRTWKHDGL